MSVSFHQTPLTTQYANVSLDGVPSRPMVHVDAFYLDCKNLSELDGEYRTFAAGEDRFIMQMTGATESEVWG